MALFSVSLFGGNLLDISGSIDTAINAGADALHIDIMDGYLTPDFGFNIGTAKTIAASYDIEVDVHLMVKKPDEFLGRFCDPNFNCITVQAEECKDVCGCLRTIKSFGIKSGLAIAPNTAASEVKEYIPLCDEMIVMTVVPGEGGGRIKANAIDKIFEIRSAANAVGSNIHIAVDGSMNVDRANRCVELGADKIIVGTAFYSAKDRTGFGKMIKGL